MARAIFLFDGDCGFCTASAEFLRRRVPTGALIDPWQRTDLRPLGLTADRCGQAVQWVAEQRDGRRHASQGAAAIADLLRSSDSRAWRIAGGVLGVAAIRALAERVYRLVARNRYRLPGSTQACAVPGAAVRP